jgi:hypothetical protein
MVQKTKDTINPKWEYKKWSFYSNPNAAEAEAQQAKNPEKETKKPKKETKKPEKETKKPKNYVTSANRIVRPIIPLCTSQITFLSMYLDKFVSELEERVLYKSSVHNCALSLFDCLLVVGNLVYVFQSSKISADSHSLDYSTIKNVMDKLKFDLNPEYKMIYVYCNNNHSKYQTGCKITNNREKDKEPDPLSEIEVAAINKRFKIKIARICYYPKLEEIFI